DGARDFGGGLAQKPRPKNTIVITQQRSGGASGDNSNSQYASLGLRACADANVKIPLEVCNLAKKWWIDSQSPDESGSKLDKNAVGTGGEVTRIQGWDYKNANEQGAKGPYHAMTAGAVGAVAIYDYLLGVNWKKDA